MHACEFLCFKRPRALNPGKIAARVRRRVAAHLLAHGVGAERCDAVENRPEPPQVVARDARTAIETPR